MVAPNGYDERFAALLKERGVSVQDVADKLKISYQAVKKVIDGKTKMFAADNNARAAAFFEVDPDWLATGEGSRLRGGIPLSARALRVAAIYDRVSAKDRRHIDAAADAASSEDGEPDNLTDDAATPPHAPTPTPQQPT